MPLCHDMRMMARVFAAAQMFYAAAASRDEDEPLTPCCGMFSPRRYGIRRNKSGKRATALRAARRSLMPRARTAARVDMIRCYVKAAARSRHGECADDAARQDYLPTPHLRSLRVTEYEYLFWRVAASPGKDIEAQCTPRCAVYV